ncbi:MBL fold metallo-hydrolase [Glaciecola sp. 1036]|uniref:MBL fold metallo-hydrolase n=1 Tax=Alteromonadaceae TaxID=72275 RepID=UPI003D0798F5
MNRLSIQPFFDESTNTVTYVVTDKATWQTAVIDPVLDYDPNSGTLSSASIDKIIGFMDENNLTLEWILETHAHSDHITASKYLKEKRGGQIGIGEHIRKVQNTFKRMFNFNGEVPCDGSQFDMLFEDGEIINLGHLEIEVIHTPGHTPACVSYKIEDSIFVGDTLFMPDYGTARTDFPNSSAKSLFYSIQKILSLPDQTRIFVGHDFKTTNRDYHACETSVFHQKRSNIHIKRGITETEFIQICKQRDAKLTAPRLLLPAMQLNICGGELPAEESNGTRYLKLPLSVQLN